jgi:hypothetical protein
MFPTINDLSSGSPFTVYDPRPRCDCAGETAPGCFVERLPLEALTDAEADLTKGGDQRVITVG